MNDDLEVVLELHVPALRRFARSLLRDTDAADDLVQECLLRAISRWRQRRHHANARAWLFTILHNLFISDRRTLRRQGGPALQVDDWDRVVPLVDSSVCAEDHLTWKDLMVGLQNLPAEQRVVLLLVGVEDLSYDEVAEVTGVPVGTVMSRLSRARSRLRRYVEGDVETMTTRSHHGRVK